MSTFTDPEDDYEETDREMLECLGARAVANLEQSLERVLAITHDPSSDPHDAIAFCERQVNRPDSRCTVIPGCFESLGAARAFGCLSVR